MVQSFTAGPSENTIQVVKTVNYIKKATKQALTPLIGRSESHDEITRALTNILKNMSDQKMFNQFSVEVVDGGEGPFRRIRESEEIAGKVPGDRYETSGMIIQRDKDGAIVFDPTKTRQDDGTWNIKVKFQPVYPVEYVTVQMEVKK